jgi:endo-1,4-beta-xylanase
MSSPPPLLAVSLRAACDIWSRKMSGFKRDLPKYLHKRGTSSTRDGRNSIMIRTFTRRHFNAAIAASAFARATLRSGNAQAAEPLKILARRGGRFWGVAGQASLLQTESNYTKLLVRECDVIVPEWEMKWAHVEPEQGRHDFAKADVFPRFANEQGLKIRGHALVWHRSVPGWAQAAMKAPSDWSIVASHIATMLKRYSGDSFIQWDVLNEVIEPKDNRDDGLRDSPFLRAFGPDYISKALIAAHERAPQMPLYLNEYGLDYDLSVDRSRRAALLRLLESLKRAQVPLHGLGIQAHLRTVGAPFSDKVLRGFLREVAGLGLKITITELDVRERDLARPLLERDRAVAAGIKSYLDVVLDEPAVVGVVTWGLSDRYSWLNTAKVRESGTYNRGLPFDEALEPKPVTGAIVEALVQHASR